MEFILFPSLEERILIKVSIALWYHDNFALVLAELDLMRVASIGTRRRLLNRIETVVIEKIRALPVPPNMFHIIKSYIRTIGLEIIKWRHYQTQFCQDEDFLRLSIAEIRWTEFGIVDDETTARVLLQSEQVSIETKYRIACCFCFVEDIVDTWIAMPADKKALFYYLEVNPDPNPFTLVDLWSFATTDRDQVLMQSIQTHNIDLNYFVISRAVQTGHKTATKYWWYNADVELDRTRFWPHIAVANGVAYVNRGTQWFLSTFHTEISHFLFSILNDRSMARFEGHGNNIYFALRCFLEWPYQPLFLKAARHVISRIRPRHFFWLLRLISKKIQLKFSDYNYCNLIMDFWEMGSETQRNLVIQQRFHMLPLLLKHSVDVVCFMLRRATTEDANTIMLSQVFEDELLKLVFDRRLDVVESFMIHMLKDLDTVLQLRFHFALHYSRCSAADCAPAINEICFILDNIVTQMEEESTTVREEIVRIFLNELISEITLLEVT